MMKSYLFAFCIFLGSTLSFAQEERPETPTEVNAQLLDFQSIRDVLKSDKLEQEVQTKQQEVKTVKREREDSNRRMFQLPEEKDFWSFFSEYWLVKNAPVVKFDFVKPDYGIAESFQKFLERMGIYNQGFKILLLNTPAIPHFALPSNDGGDIIILLSVPFIRTLDLSLQEISLLLFEDYLRAKQGYFKSMATSPELTAFLGSNFQGQKLDRTVLQKLSKKYDEIIFDKGFQFQQQFEVTRLMDGYLKSDLALWSVYFSMIQKKDEMVKKNTLYQKYNQIYPSTELQMNWLRPKQSVL